jgi:hypothetical protein
MRILCLRVARRALAAATWKDERFELLDGRHLSSDRGEAGRTVEKYLGRLISEQETRGVVLLAPSSAPTQPTSMLRVVQTILVRAGVSLRIVPCDELLRAFGHPALKNRRELQEVAASLLPEAGAFRGATRPYVLEAAALGLYANTLFELLAHDRNTT